VEPARKLNNGNVPKRPKLGVVQGGGQSSGARQGNLASVPTGRNVPEKPGSITSPSSRPNLRVIQGGNQGSEEPQDASQDGYSSQLSNQIRDQENAAGAGKPSPFGGALAGSGLGGGLKSRDDKGLNAAPVTDPMATRTKLSDRENDNFFRPEKDTGKSGGGYSLKNMVKGTRRKVALAGFLSSLVGLGSGFGLLGYVAGPAQLIQSARLLSGTHLETRDDQFNNFLMMAIHAKNGEVQRSRLGYLGNHYADKAETVFQGKGFAFDYDRVGTFQGYIIDPTKATGGDFKDLNSQSPEDLQEFLKSNYGVDSTVNADGKVVVSSTGSSFSYKANRALTKSILKSAGINKGISALYARNAGQRAGMGRLWHPINKIDRKILNASKQTVKAYVEKQRTESVERGSGSLKIAGIESATDEEGVTDPEAAGDAADVTDTADTAEQARTDDTAREKLRSSLTGKLAGGVGALVGFFCIILSVDNQVDQINQANIVIPSQRILGENIARGSQVQTSVDIDGETEQLGIHSEHFIDKEAKTTFFDAMSIRSEQGKAGGTDLTDDKKINDDKNPISRFIDGTGVRDQLTTTCKIIGGAFSTLLMTGIGLASGPLTFLITTAISEVGTKLFIDLLVNVLTGDQIDPAKLYGAQYGGVASQGGRFFANNMGSSMGGLPMSTAQSAELKADTRADQVAEFQSQSLAYRMFNTEDPMSFMGQVIQKQQPDPTQNVAMYATGILNVGKNLGSLLGNSIISAKVGAAKPIPYDYGVPEIGFTKAEMENKTYTNAEQNAASAIKILDEDNSDPKLVERARVCFGVTITQRNVENVLQWTLDPPRDGEEPITKYVLEGRSKDEGDTTDYKCVDRDDVNWTTIRFFIAHSQAMNSFACYEGDADDPDTIQACIDAGQDPEGGYEAAMHYDATDESSAYTEAPRLWFALNLSSLFYHRDNNMNDNKNTDLYSEVFNHQARRMDNGYVS